MKLKFFKKIIIPTFLTLSAYTGLETYRQGFNANEFYYFLNGFYRGIRSLKDGAKIVINYKLVNIFKFFFN